MSTQTRMETGSRTDDEKGGKERENGWTTGQTQRGKQELFRGRDG